MSIQKKLFEELRLKDAVINELKQHVQKLDRRIKELETGKRIKVKVFYSLCSLVLTIPMFYMLIVYGAAPDGFHSYRWDIQAYSFVGILIMLLVGLLGPVLVSLYIWTKD